MEFRKQINRSEIVGTTKSKTAVVEALVRSNALNRTGVINYNAYGAKDGIGFEKATEKLSIISCFVLLFQITTLKMVKTYFLDLKTE